MVSDGTDSYRIAIMGLVIRRRQATLSMCIERGFRVMKGNGENGH